MDCRHILLLVALGISAAGCRVRAEQVGDDRYQIPPENLLRNTFAGEYVRLVYGSSVPDAANEVALVFSGREVAAAVPGFRSRVQGYPGLVDASPSAVVSLAEPASNFGEMLAQNVARLDPTQEFLPYGDTEFFWPKNSEGMFELTAAKGAWLRDDLIPPGCRISQTGAGGTYHRCLFRLRRDGFEFSFYLSGENVAFADEYADFVLAKLKGWKVAAAD